MGDDTLVIWGEFGRLPSAQTGTSKPARDHNPHCFTAWMAGGGTTLSEDRVRRVILPMLAGSEDWDYSLRDLEYVRDLGLVARAGEGQIANPTYAEVVPREITGELETSLFIHATTIQRRCTNRKVTNNISSFAVTSLTQRI